jgi:hypothetical protein
MKKKKTSVSAKTKSKKAALAKPAAGRTPAAKKPVVAPATAPAGRTKGAQRAESVGPQAFPGNSEILRELREIRLMLAQDRAVATSADAALEDGVDSLRRLLSEMIERRMEWVLSRVVALRTAVTEAPRVVREIDGLLEELGAIRFTAQSMDHVDPLIHVVVDERKTTGGPEGVILETVRPGYRTSAGTILSKACVAVSRRV